jgi:branched-chain amino acid transport system permease protein
MSYLHHILIMICFYVILGSSLNLALGFGGMLSLCHAAFYGIGAYASALLMIKAGWPFVAAMGAAGAIAAVLAYVISIPFVRFRGDFFVMATLGFQMIIFSVLYNWTDLTNGLYGLSSIPRPALFGMRASSTPALLLLVAVLAVVTVFIVWRLVSTPYGRTLQAVRDDDISALSLGKNSAVFKRSAFIIAGVLAAMAGVFFAGYAGYIDPNSFTLEESIFVLCVVIIGGAGNLYGPILGAVVLTILPELLRFVGLPNSVAANLRQIIYGLLLVLMMRFRPRGIAGKYAFD